MGQNAGKERKIEESILNNIHYRNTALGHLKILPNDILLHLLVFFDIQTLSNLGKLFPSYYLIHNYSFVIIEFIF